MIDLTIQWTLPREAFFHSSTKQPLPSIPFIISKSLATPWAIKHYHSAYHSFITHIDPTLWTKRCVGKDTCKRKKRKKNKMGKKKKQKSKFKYKSFHKCKSISKFKSKAQSPDQIKSKSLKSTLRAVGHFINIKPFSTLKPQPHITTTKALSHEALFKSSSELRWSDSVRIRRKPLLEVRPHQH